MSNRSKITSPIRIPLPTGLPVGDVNAYLFPEPKPTLLDTGINIPEALSALRAALSEHGLALADLRRVIISHPHVDHFGLSAAIAAESQATFHIFEPAMPWLTDYPHPWQARLHYIGTLFRQLNLPADIADPIIEYYHAIQSTGSGVPAGRVFPLYANQSVQMGPLAWTMLHTPGHASTLTCFYQPETRQFLSTDMLLRQTPTPIVEQPAEPGAPRTLSLPQFIESLGVVRQLDIDMVHPGHGKPFTDHRALIDAQLKRIDKRKEECFALLQAGHTEVAPMLLAMYPLYPPAFRFAGLWMLIGYLDLLKQEGRIVEETVGGTLRYRPA